MYTVDESNGDIVIGGFQAGIGDSPFSGTADARSVNLISVPGQAPVNFATSNIASGAISGTATSVAANVLTATIAGTMENYVAIYFTSLGSYTGISLYTPYWVGNLSGSTFKIYSDYQQTSLVTVTGSGSAVFIAYQINVKPTYITGGSAAGATGLNGIQYFAQPTNIQDSALATYYKFGVDGYGQVWGTLHVTGTNSFWTYTGNAISDKTASGFPDNGNSNASGNGLFYWRVSNGGTGTSVAEVDYLFVIRNSQIDYFPVQGHTYGGGPTVPTLGVWVYGWLPSNGTPNNANYLTTAPGTSGSHAGLVGPDNRTYFCDGNNIQKIAQTSSGTIFDPTSTATYTFTTFNILPVNDLAQCISPLGTGYLIGGQSNIVYQWDSTSNLASGYIPVAESFIAKIVTVNVNAYIFAGNRGRIYITNGSQANLWKKIPDHISGVIEPRYTWGGAGASRNQLYFSFILMNNAGTSLTTSGGLWAIDLNSGVIRITNQLSYGTYGGYASALIAQVYNPVSALGLPTENTLLIGWYDGVSLCGIDQPSSNPYTNGASWVTSELIPIGTALKPTTPTQIEYKLSSPLVAGESVQIKVGKYLDPTYASFSTLNFNGASTSSGAGKLSDITDDMPIQEFQWIIIQAILTSTNTTPSYVPITELRLKGATLRQSALYNLA